MQRKRYTQREICGTLVHPLQIQQPRLDQTQAWSLKVKSSLLCEWWVSRHLSQHQPPWHSSARTCTQASLWYRMLAYQVLYQIPIPIHTIFKHLLMAPYLEIHDVVEGPGWGALREWGPPINHLIGDDTHWPPVAVQAVGAFPVPVHHS